MVNRNAEHTSTLDRLYVILYHMILLFIIQLYLIKTRILVGAANNAGDFFIKENHVFALQKVSNGKIPIYHQPTLMLKIDRVFLVMNISASVLLESV